MTDLVTDSGDNPPPPTSILTSLTNQMTEALSKVQTPTHSTEIQLPLAETCLLAVHNTESDGGQTESWQP